MTKPDDPAVADERPELLILCGALGLIGPLAMTLGIVVVQTMSPGHDWVSDTISDLARDDTAWIMDPIFYLNAAAMLALAIGAAHLHVGRWDWSLGLFALAGIALVITLLGVWDEFYSAPGVDKVSVHTRLATLLFPLFTIGPLAMARGIGRVGARHRTLFLASGLLWPITALVYFYGPAEYYGLTERIAGATTLLWVLPLGLWFLRRGLRRA